MTNQKVPDGRSTSLSESKVVFSGASFVAMTFDCHGVFEIFFEMGHPFLELSLGHYGKSRVVKFKKYAIADLVLKYGSRPFLVDVCRGRGALDRGRVQESLLLNKSTLPASAHHEKSDADGRTANDSDAITHSSIFPVNGPGKGCAIALQCPPSHVGPPHISKKTSNGW